ncbi:methylamine utilization protein [Alteromonas sediminis]|uniref:Methylamine utilization protein n=1 Tax=Alteromonas sediminis TaxID=2259342 RepID=A0A3N5Y196_9ALTE|nr:methylamine utilization protein [Alteromonas sediminis]RPJ67372.1 methylamine utilization protein [Alteromonas sediminis]
MTRSLVQYVSFFLLNAIIHTNAYANSTTVRVVDENGQPISGVVVSTPSNKDMVPPDEPAIMDQINRRFVPYVLTINKGQYVNFPNSDDVRHHVYSFSDAKQFEIGLYKGVNAAPVLFEKSGVVDIGCNIHDSMVGFIYVGDNEIITKTDENGVARLAVMGSHFHLWHPRLSADKGFRQKNTFTPNPTNNQQTVVLTLLPEQEEDTDINTFGGKKRFKVSEQ